MKIYKPGVVTALATAMVLATGGSAYAYWVVNGTGTGTATVAAIRPLQITQDTVVGLVLDKPVTLSGKLKNLNDFEVSLKGTELAVTGTIDTDHAGCVFADNFTLLAPKPNTKSIAPNDAINVDGGSITLTNDPKVNQVACQEAIVTLTYTLK